MPKKLTTEDFICKANTVHSCYYLYNKSVYTISKEKLIITCKEHGDFLQTPTAHLSGQGCPLCGNLKRNISTRKTTKNFIEEAIIVHNNLYTYNNTLYINWKTPVIITCKKHGDFLQIPNNHLRGAGCKECSTLNNTIKRITSQEEFIYKSNLVHNNKYSYLKSIYLKAKQHVIITCKKHGDFLQMPDKHLAGQGCPKCSTIISKPEVEVFNFLSKSCASKVIQSNKSIIKPYELDIVIEDYKLAIEYNGLYWHSERTLKKRNKNNNYHKNKAERTSSRGYNLVTIFEPEWLLKKPIVKSVLLAKCNIFKYKVGARKCVLKKLTTKTAKVFFNTNHIQGFARGEHFGLYYGTNLVSAMSFSKYKKEYNLTRFANKKSTLVYGAFSKLLKYFIKNTTFSKIFTFADMRYFTGEVYEKNGFKFVHYVAPSYYYFKGASGLLHKRNFQKARLKTRFKNYDPELTEYQNCLNNGYDRIWDCGKIKYELIN